MLNEPVYSISGCHLGDVWASLNYFYHMSIKEQRVIRVSSSFRYSKSGYVNILDKLVECLEVLCDPGHLEIVKNKPTEKPIDCGLALKCGYFSTRSIWSKGKSREVLCYQFDSVKFAAKKMEMLNRRTIPLDDIREFLEKVKSMGWQLENLGGKRPLKETVEIASTAKIFVGAVSGLAEVCTSVGIPMHIVINEYPMKWAQSIYGGRKCMLHQKLSDIDLDNPSKIVMS